MLIYNEELSINTKKLIFEYKERYPFLSPKEISEMFAIDLFLVKKLFNEKYLIIPSKMNNLKKENNGKS